MFFKLGHSSHADHRTKNRRPANELQLFNMLEESWNARASLAIQSERPKDYSERNKIVLMGHSMEQLANRRTVNVRPQIIEYEHRNR